MPCSKGIIVFQSGGGGTPGNAEVAKEKKRDVGLWHKNHGAGEVALVSKTHIFSLNLLPLSEPVWLYGDNHSVCSLPCSNYDKEYHKWQLYVLTDSSPDPEEHPYGAEDSQALPSWGKSWCHIQAVMGGSDSALGKGYCGLSRWGGGLQASMHMACCPSH